MEPMTTEEINLKTEIKQLEKSICLIMKVAEQRKDHIEEKIRALMESCDHRLITYYPQQYDSFRECDICGKYNPKARSII